LKIGKNPFGSELLIYVLLPVCKTEFGSDTSKWVFIRGGGIHPPPGHPEISDAGSNKVNTDGDIKGKKGYSKAA
jgi:hypothetical protein